MPRPFALLVLAATVAIAGCGTPPARVATAPRLRADQCIDEVTRAVVTRGEAHARCESDSAEETFAAGPRPDVPPAPPHEEPTSSSTLGRDIAIGTIGLGVIGGTVYCTIKCPDPWDTAVPLSVGGALGLAVIVAIATADWSRFAVGR